MEYGEELRTVQLTILDIFKEVLRICEKNKISYFVIAGTALGAVRHKGFIPWDDDLDIGMTRDNYEKFLKIAQNELPEDLFLQTIKTDPESPYYFAKIRKTGTKFLEKYCKGLDIHHGIYVDIFPFDNVPDDNNLRRLHYRKVSVLSNLFIAKCVKGTSVPQKGIVGFIKKSIRIVLHYLLKPVPKLYLYEKLDKTCKKYNKIDCKSVSYAVTPSLQLPLSDVKKNQDICFEGISVKCPMNVNSYLRNVYGDYLELPAEEDRVGHRPFILEV